METLNRFQTYAILIFSFLVNLCGGGTQMIGDVNKTESENVRQIIKSDLAVGADPSEIELFSKKHGLKFIYDKYSKRYQGVILDVSPDPKVDQAIAIYLYVDDQMKFVRAEVHDSFTMP